MNTRTYKASADYDSTQDHFTIETIGRQYYLKIGSLNTDDQHFIESLIANGHVGFFDDSDERVAFTTIEGIYDETNDRVEIGSNPTELIVDVKCVIRFSQARPGTVISEDTAKGDDGEHAEIKIEDTPDEHENAPGIRVSGKSGGKENFGEWFYVNDGKKGDEGNTESSSSGNFSFGFWTPVCHRTIWQIKLHDGSPGPWYYGNPNSLFIEPTSLAGRWLRWGNQVYFTICFYNNIGTSIPHGVERISLYFGQSTVGTLPQGTRGSALHGIGAPIDARVGWFGVQPQLGDYRQHVRSNGTRYINTTYPGGNTELQNSIRIDLSTAPAHDGILEALIAAQGIYHVVTE